MNRKAFLIVATVLFALAALWVALSPSPGAAASSAVDAWYSSAEAPSGTPLEAYSPADDPNAVAMQDDALAPEALVSWRVIGSAFNPRENDVSYRVDSNGGCTYVTAGDASTVWNTPIALPNGSRIDTLRMY